MNDFPDCRSTPTSCSPRSAGCSRMPGRSRKPDGLAPAVTAVVPQAAEPPARQPQAATSCRISR